MALSNTAVPRYYGMFREAVIAGDIPVCEEISLAMNLIDQLIADPRYYYDDEAVERYISYCENELTLTDGSKMTLLPTFKLWAEDLLSWYYYEPKTVVIPGGKGERARYETRYILKRLRNLQYLILGRGGAKSIYMSTMQNYFLNCDLTTTHQITTAPTMKQAEEVIAPIRTSIARARGPLMQFLTEGSLQSTNGSGRNRQKLASTKKGIENSLTGSLLEIRPMSIDKLQGLQVKCSTVDEWLSGTTKEDPILAIEQGAKKVKDWVIIAASSEGNVRNGPGDSIKMQLLDILRGKYLDPHTSIWYYRLDDISEVSNPDMWPKAQPNIGYTVSYSDYQQEVEKAEKVPHVRNEILAKRFGIPMEGLTYFFTFDEIQLHRTREYWQMPCTLGADLSQGDDFCAFTFLFPKAGGFGVKTRNYITEYTMSKLPRAMRDKYMEFID
jgi:phage terminase large subunit-like protein